jgi:hypothetical protein
MIHKTVLICSLAALALSCNKSNPTPEKDPVTSMSAAPFASASASVAAIPVEAPKDVLPLLVPDVPLEGTRGFRFFPIEGAFIVVDGLKVGRYVEGKVEWIGTLPETNQSLGGSQITDVTGVWPDVDVHFRSSNGRALQPSVYPLTGKGNMVTFGPGGGLGWLNGTVRLGKTTLAAGFDFYAGSRFDVVRGPGVLVTPIPAEKGGCNVEEMHTQGQKPIAVVFSAVAVTGKGHLVTVGSLCDDRKKPAAEIFDEPRKSHIVELGHLLPEFDYFPQILVGKGDEFWVASHGVLHYLDGKFEMLPLPTHAIKALFVSASGKLHGVANTELVRYDDGKWTPIARVSRDAKSYRMSMDEKGTIWLSNDGISKLREAQGNEGDKLCTTPFVYLYDVSWRNENKFTFPSTRKALATFPDVAKIKLMEYNDYWGRRLGVQVESEAQAEAVIKHIKATMKDELPEFVCYAPQNPRVIDMNGGK